MATCEGEEGLGAERIGKVGEQHAHDRAEDHDHHRIEAGGTLAAIDLSALAGEGQPAR